MRDKTCEEILEEAGERIKTMAKELLEALMKEEGEIYLESHPTKANGYYTRDLLTLVGPVGDLKVPPRAGRRFSSSDLWVLALWRGKGERPESGREPSRTVGGGRPKPPPFSPSCWVILSLSATTSTPLVGAARQGVKRRSKVAEVFCGEDAVEKLLYWL